MKQLFHQKIKSLITYNNLKIRQKIFLLIMLTTLISTCILFSSTYIIYRKSIKTRIQHYNSSIIGQIIKNIDSYFLDLQYIAYSLAYNPDLQNYITSSNKSAYKMKQQNDFITNALRFYYHSESNIQICIFLEDNIKPFYTINSYINHNYNFKDDDWYKIATRSKNQFILLLNNPQNYYDISQRKPVHSLIYKIQSRASNKNIGYIVIDIDKDWFKKFFQTEYVDIKNTLILNIDGQTVYNYPEDTIIRDNIVVSLPLNKKWGYYDIDIDGEQYMVIFGTSDYSGWKIVNIVSYKDMLRELTITKHLYLFITLIVIVIALGISYGFSTFITKPILALKKAMDRVKNGDFC